MDDPRVWICYGGEPGFFWRAIHNTFPLSAVQRKWQLAAVYVENTAVRESSSMRDLLQLGCGTGTREDPLIIRGELATDAIAQELFYCQTIPRQVAAFTLTGDRQVQLWQIARHFGLWPWTAWIQGAGREGKLFIEHVQSSSERRGSPEEPFQLRGYYGPFSKGDVGSFRSFASSDGVLDLELREPLHISFSTSVYSASMISGGGEEVVLKLDYDPGRNLCTKIGLECAALADLRDAGIMSQSLPVLVRRGFYRPSGSLSLQREYGEVSGIVTRPRGTRRVEGMVLHGEKLCKVAFDVLLALYHLHLVGRKHRDVRAQNIVLVAENQFMLIDLELAYRVEMESLYSGSGNKEAAASDCHKLLSCLLELSTGLRHHYVDDEMIAEMLARESGVLGEFAKDVLGLSCEAWPDFQPWLWELGARGCTLSHETVENAVAGRVSSEAFSSPPLRSIVRDPYPAAAVWITYQEETRFFLPAANGRFPLLRVKHVWNLSEVCVAGVAIRGDESVSEVCGARGTRLDPVQVTGVPGVPRVVRCDEVLAVVRETLKRIAVPQDYSCYTGLSQMLAMAKA